MFNKILVFILFFFFIISLDLFSAKIKFLPDIEIQSYENEFVVYQVKSKIYAASILLNKFLLNENPSTKIKIELNNKYKNPEFILEPAKNHIMIKTDGLNFSNHFIKLLIINMLSSEYKLELGKLEGSWLAEGCFSYVNRNMNRNNNRELIFMPYIAPSINNTLKSKKIVQLTDINTNELIQNLYQELSETLVSSILSLPDGKIILYNYAHGKGFDFEKTDTALNYKIKSLTQQAKINNSSIDTYLAKVEKEKIPLQQRYYLHFNIIKTTPALLSIIWPRLNKFLDNEYPAGLNSK